MTPKILVVDDIEQNRIALESILSSLDVEVIQADSGTEALAKTLRHEFALILLDVQMPEIDGFETAELLANNESTQGIPIIFVTAINKEEMHVFKGYESGAVDYLFKPVNPDILVAKVRVFLDLHDQKNQLKDINRELSRSNTDLKQFASVVSHDLKAPLYKASLLIESVLDINADSFEPDTHNSLLKVKQSLAHMDEFIRDILTYSKYNSGGSEFESVDLSSIVAEILDDLDPVINEKNGKVQLQHLPKIQGDKTQLKQLFQNLISNSLKYCPKERAPEVSISSSENQGNNSISILITDNGIGIEKSQLEEIFLPFHRVKTKEKYQGTGIGLAIVKRVMDLHKGEVDVKSTLGSGTSFTLTLPNAVLD